eukprot:symbB.v1.2.016387.t1/scaffold1246.1/size129174/4
MEAPPVQANKRRKLASAEVAICLQNMLPATPSRSSSLASWRLFEEVQSIQCSMAGRPEIVVQRVQRELQVHVQILELRPDGAEAVEIDLHCSDSYPLVPPVLRHSNWRRSGLVVGWPYEGELIRLPHLEVDHWSFTMGLPDLLADLLDAAA